jgi:hypothetical protein
LLASKGLPPGIVPFGRSAPLLLAVALAGCDGTVAPLDDVAEQQAAPAETVGGTGSLDLSFSAMPSMVDEGGSTTLSWSAADADSCTAGGGWSGDRPVSGSAEVGPLTSGETFTLSCSGPDGNTIQMLSVPVIGPVTLSWVAPEENVDGSALSDLAGYRIYRGDESRSYTEQVNVQDPRATSHTMALPTGEYFFAMTAVDGEGNESAYSNEVIKTRN